MSLWNTTCNATLDEMRILPGDERIIVGPLTFHDLAVVIGAASTMVAIAMSFWLIWMHATHYTKPQEQRHIIRILFMVPVYATASLLSIRFYWHAIYFQVMSDCYEAFAISSFFALLCAYIAPDLHEQKAFFRAMQPIKPWVWPLDWFRACCCGQRGPWRTPRSGLTWFNVIWIGIYHYCFVRVAATITAVVTNYFHKYCESSNSPVFAHIWVIVVVFIAVGIAMYCLIQFYVQMREPLAEHKPFLKICAIKLVVFLSFWQSASISVATSQLELVKPNEIFAYPDLKVGIPALLLCFEMALFSILHIWAFPYAPYRVGAKTTYYPVADPDSGIPPKENVHFPPSGGFLGFAAIWDALNLWDVVKAFGRGIRWLFVGVKNRGHDGSYTRKGSNASSADFDLGTMSKARPGLNSTEHLPIANQFRRSKFLLGLGGSGSSSNGSTSAASQTAGGSNRMMGPGPFRPQLRSQLSPVPQSPMSAQRPQSSHENHGLIANAASPGRDPSSPYHDDYPDDLINHPGVAVPYPGYNERMQQQQQRGAPQGIPHQQQAPPNEQSYSGPYRPQQNFSRNGSPYGQPRAVVPREDGMI